MDDMNFVCVTCGKGFKRSDNFKKHLLVHDEIRPFQCNVCGKAFRERNHLTTHGLLHTGEKPFKCSYCDRAFNQKSNLNRHIKIHTDDRPFVCNICGGRFTQQCYLKEHMKCHTGEKAYECLTCGKKFKNTSHLKSHQKTHSNERPYNCSLCDKTFKYIRNYSLHLMSHDGDVSQCCAVCGKDFLNRNDLSFHMLYHIKLKEIECFVCGKEFQKLFNFKRHLQVHTGACPIKCPFCEEGFKSKTSLKYHMMLHTGEKPFTCEICGNGFRSKSHLNSHMVSHNKSPHECNVCGKAFKYKSNFKQHMQTHGKRETVRKQFRHSSILHKNIYTSEKVISQTSKSSVLKQISRENHDVKQNLANELQEVLPVKTKQDIIEKVTVTSSMIAENQSAVGNLGYKSNNVSEVGIPSSFKMHSLDCVKIMVNSCSNDYPFHCHLCKETFRQEDHLEEHLDFHNTDPFYCHQCQVYFKNNESFEQHLKDHMLEEKEVKVLGISEKDWKTKNGEKFQRKAFHKEKLQVLSHLDKQAQLCKKTNNKYLLKPQRLRSNSGESVFPMPEMENSECNKLMPRYITRDKPFSCNVCDVKFSYLHNLETHKIIHILKNDALRHNSKENVEKDEIDIENSIADKIIIQSLMGRYHHGNLASDLNSKETITHLIAANEIDGVEIDQVSMTIDEGGIFEAKVRKSVSLLESSVATKPKSFVCIICNEDCREQAVLKAHLKQHKPECLQCGKIFNRLNNLKRHMVVHANVGSYKCSFCDKTFKKSSHLKSHGVIIHSENGGFECEVCQKRFAYNSTYQKHLKKHTKDKANFLDIEEHSHLLKNKRNKKKETTNESDNDNINTSVVTITGTQNDLRLPSSNSDASILKSSLCIKVFSEKSTLDKENSDGNSRELNRISQQCNKESEVNLKRNIPYIDSTNSEDIIHKTVNHSVEKSNTKVSVDDRKCIRIPQGDLDVANEILSKLVEPAVEIQLGKFSVQAISYEAALKRRQMLKDKKLHKCFKCGRLFRRKSNLVRHIQNHKNKQFFECNSCDSSFMEKALLEAHMLLHNSQPVNTLGASRKMVLEKDDQKHLSISEIEASKNDSFSLKSIHSVDSFTSQSFIEENFHVCSVCGMKFQFKHHLDNHRIIHNLQKMIGNENRDHHKIIIKSRGTKTVASLERGQIDIEYKTENKDMNEKLSAPENNQNEGKIELGKLTVKTLPLPTALERCLKVDDSKKQIFCEICNKEFSSSGGLKVHFLKIHGNIKCT